MAAVPYLPQSFLVGPLPTVANQPVPPTLASPSQPYPQSPSHRLSQGVSQPGSPSSSLNSQQAQVALLEQQRLYAEQQRLAAEQQRLAAEQQRLADPRLSTGLVRPSMHEAAIEQQRQLLEQHRQSTPSSKSTPNLMRPAAEALLEQQRQLAEQQKLSDPRLSAPPTLEQQRQLAEQQRLSDPRMSAPPTMMRPLMTEARFDELGASISAPPTLEQQRQLAEQQRLSDPRMSAPPTMMRPPMTEAPSPLSLMSPTSSQPGAYTGFRMPQQLPGSTGAPTLQLGAFTATGQKPNTDNYVNQDSHLEMPLSEGRLLLGVFDGHGSRGTQVSSRVKDLFAEMAPAIASAPDARGAIQQAFAHAVNTIRRENIGTDSGCTGTVALVDSAAQRVTIAHVGDSTAIVVDPRGTVIFMSTDHKPCLESEAQRLRARGSQITNGRVKLSSSPNDHLGLARTIGDFPYEAQGVFGEPDIILHIPFEPGSAVIIGSDGVWDMLSQEEAAKMVMQAGPQEAAQRIVNTARSAWVQRLQNGSLAHIDDITVTLVRYVPGEASNVALETMALPAMPALQTAPVALETMALPTMTALGTAPAVAPTQKIPGVEAPSPVAYSSPAPAYANPGVYAVGEPIRALYPKYYNATIASINPDGTLTVRWNDNDPEDTVKTVQQIRPKAGPGAVLQAGSLVEAEFRGWHRAIVNKPNGDGSYTVDWEDGDMRDRIKWPRDMKKREA